MKGAKRRLTKLKSALKKLPSFTKRICDSTTGESNVAGKLHPVYVGKSRRQYLVSSDVIDHPLFQVLVDKSNGGGDGGGGGISVDCEVVLFDHLLWMLENSDSHLVSMGELLEHTKVLLNEISGEARDSEILAVLGASGSGKSTS